MPLAEFQYLETTFKENSKSFDLRHVEFEISVRYQRRNVHMIVGKCI